MISGSSRRTALAAALVLGLGPAPGFAAEAWGLERLMAIFAKVQSSQARFVERSELSLLNEPVETSGTLSYLRPHTLEKQTLQPRRESLRVEGDRLTVIQPDGTSRSLSVSSVPEIQAYVESIRATLGGDLPTLRRFYKVVMEGGLERWQLQLTPLDRKVAEMVRQIVISGSNGSIGQVEVHQVDGDHSEMTILPGPP
jgi:outer membrane lipoprotein-sorting protein